MATIQIRDIPEDVYEVIRRRAHEAGQSLQAFMREHVITFGSRPTKSEILEEWFRELDSRDVAVTGESVLRDLDETRAERDQRLDG